MATCTFGCRGARLNGGAYVEVCPVTHTSGPRAGGGVGRGMGDREAGDQGRGRGYGGERQDGQIGAPRQFVGDGKYEIFEIKFGEKGPEPVPASPQIKGRRARLNRQRDVREGALQDNAERH